MTKRVMSSIITHNKLQDRMTVYGKLEEIDRTRLDQVRGRHWVRKGKRQPSFQTHF